jgi:hypothetical protein
LEFLIYFPLDKNDTQLELKSGGFIRVDNILQYNYLRCKINGIDCLIETNEITFNIRDEYISYFNDTYKLNPCNATAGVRWMTKNEASHAEKNLNGLGSNKQKIVDSKGNTYGELKWSLRWRSIYYTTISEAEAEAKSIKVQTEITSKHATTIDVEYYNHKPLELQASNYGRFPSPHDRKSNLNCKSMSIQNCQMNKVGIFAKPSNVPDNYISQLNSESNSMGLQIVLDSEKIASLDAEVKAIPEAGGFFRPSFS